MIFFGRTFSPGSSLFLFFSCFGRFASPDGDDATRLGSTTLGIDGPGEAALGTARAGCTAMESVPAAAEARGAGTGTAAETAIGVAAIGEAVGREIVTGEEAIALCTEMLGCRTSGEGVAGPPLVETALMEGRDILIFLGSGGLISGTGGGGSGASATTNLFWGCVL